ncbi:MAG: DUF4147 domain-containing protein [Blastocatellales bacterium]|nr:DUF4147 domain-containing protein [Blastocatellales bacterium]
MPMNLRQQALEIFHRTLAEIDVERISRRAVKEYIMPELDAPQRVICIGIGKACVAMGRAIEDALGERLTGGLLATNAVVGETPQKFRIFLAGHPVPNHESLAAARSGLEMLRANDDETTLAVFLITGGGSAQFELPVDPRLTLDDLREVNRVLVGCGAVIGEMNIIRRHLSAVKGGRLAEAAPHSRRISLYISDVNSDDLASVASGPTLPGASTLEDFHRIIQKYDLLPRFPPAVRELIAEGSIGPLPKQTNNDARSAHHLLLDNRKAIDVARAFAEGRGFVCETARDLVEGDVAENASEHLRRIADLKRRNPGRRVCLLSGGEVICPVRGAGLGGRNQEFVLRAAIELAAQELRDVVVLSAGTDGIDGNSPAAGAIADAGTAAKARALGLSPEAALHDSDSYSLFAALGDSIMTGPTGNNVRDLRLLLAQ